MVVGQTVQLLLPLKLGGDANVERWQHVSIFQRTVTQGDVAQGLWVC